MIDLKKLIEEKNTETEKSLEGISGHISVSSIKESIRQPFDEEAVARKCSERDRNNRDGKYYGLSPDDIISSWTTKAENGRTFGKVLDKYMENQLVVKSDSMRKLLLLDHPEFRKTADAIDKFLEYLKENGFSFLCREVPLETIHSTSEGKYLVTGRPDAFFMYNDYIVIFDWKSDDIIRTENRFQKLSYPLAVFDDCSWNVYSLQVRMYEYFMKSVYGIPENYKITSYLCNFPKTENASFKILRPNANLHVTDDIFSSLTERTVLFRKAEKDVASRKNIMS